MKFLTKGYQEDPEALLKGALFTVNYDEMVIVKDIEMFSLCEHHMLPFFGKVHVAYIPNGKVIGLSKIPRLIELFSPPPADSGAPDHTNRRDHSESHRAARRWRRHRSPPPLHDDARRRKTTLRRGHFVHARLLPQRRRNSLRISLTDPPTPQRRLTAPGSMRGASRPSSPFVSPRVPCGDQVFRSGFPNSGIGRFAPPPNPIP